MKKKQGLLAEADGGYLFLDEVHNLSAENQEKTISVYRFAKNIECWATAKNWQTAKGPVIVCDKQKIFTVHCLQHSERRIPFENPDSGFSGAVIW